MRVAVRLVPALLLPALLQSCSDRADAPATPDQIAKLDQVVERVPAVKPLADKAKADGTVTQREILDVFTAAEKVKKGDGTE
ncbi:MAG: hypothetical protein LJE69_11785 [Thiohalocapsa sp.]|jgi:hypothetical protein|uniref:hypothetical protein n=1 Tax=Thiohalocapsa sp. TaxID=2497641 RepID=UPI0025CCF215|nr:hypothetical protein [Thiohalocapsa sp.]MCG6941916.1 hypothetical protein [Thiohalocapsa sp.]